MDIIDVGAMGVRAAVLQLRHREVPLRFTLYPMVHLAERSFYATIANLLRGHDLIVAEGIRGQSRRGRMLTLTYRLAGRNRRLGLEIQSRDLVEVGVPVVWADMAGGDFDERWRGIGLLERIGIWCLCLPVALYLRLFGSRELLARYLALDDDILNVRVEPDLAIDKILGDERDTLLVQALAGIHDARRDEDANVAVVYGAGHVHPVVSYLTCRYGYVVRGGDWITVFTL